MKKIIKNIGIEKSQVFIFFSLALFSLLFITCSFIYNNYLNNGPVIIKPSEHSSINNSSDYNIEQTPDFYVTRVIKK